MDTHTLTYILDILLLFAMPIALGIFLVRKFDLEGRFWWIAAFVFILSQIGQQPFDAYIVNPFLNNLSTSAALPSMAVLIIGALVLGLSAGLWEELFRYGMLRWWVKDARTWEEGVLLGTGHGGAASIILGCLVLYNFVNMSMVRHANLANLVSADQVPALQAAVNAFWSVPWYYTFREAAEQLFTLPVQICLAVLVLQAFTRKQWFWVPLAIGLHALMEAAKVISLNLGNEYVFIGVLGLFAVASVYILYALRRSKPSQEPSLAGTGQPAPTERTALKAKTVEETLKALKDDKSK